MPKPIAGQFNWIPVLHAYLDSLDVTQPTSAAAVALKATFVTVEDSAGAPVTTRHTRVVLDEFGEIDDIVSEAI